MFYHASFSNPRDHTTQCISTPIVNYTAAAYWQDTFFGNVSSFKYDHLFRYMTNIGSIPVDEIN